MGRMIIDTAGFIHWPQTESEVAGPVSQLRETEHAPATYLLLDQLDVRVATPSREGLKQIEEIAARTGDLGGLSPVDLDVLALGLEQDCEIATDDHRVQNVAEASGMAWTTVSGNGISSNWTWKLKCVGCRREWGDLGPDPKIEECGDCGSKVRLVRS